MVARRGEDVGVAVAIFIGPFVHGPMSVYIHGQPSDSSHHLKSRPASGVSNLVRHTPNSLGWMSDQYPWIRRTC